MMKQLTAMMSSGVQALCSTMSLLRPLRAWRSTVPRCLSSATISSQSSSDTSISLTSSPPAISPIGGSADAGAGAGACGSAAAAGAAAGAATTGAGAPSSAVRLLSFATMYSSVAVSMGCSCR